MTSARAFRRSAQYGFIRFDMTLRVASDMRHVRLVAFLSDWRTTRRRLARASSEKFDFNDLGYKADSREFTIGAYGTLEFKYQLDRGAAMLYEWKATEPVSFDFHTEREGNPDASDTFEKGEAAGKRGAYLAPYAGIHGWYWKNNTDREVTITLTSTGVYPSAKLFRDGGTGQDVPLTGASR